MSHVSVSTHVRGTGRVSDETWLGTIGTISGLRYSWNEPGGPATLSCTLACDPRIRHAALSPGRVITAWAGGAEMWRGFLDTAEPQDGGFSISATGIGSAGNNARAYAPTGNGYLTDIEVADGINRGVLPWKAAPPIGQPNGYPRAWGFAERGSVTITDSVEWRAIWNSGRWTIDANGQLLFPPPLTSPTRMLLVGNTGGGRTLEDYANVLVAKYQVAVNVNAITSNGDQRSIARHGRREEYVDYSSIGIATETDVRAALAATLARFGYRARWTGSFACTRGMVRVMQGGAEEPCAVRPGHRYLLQVIAPDQNGEIDPSDLSFVAGETSYEADSDTVTITPQESARRSLQDVLINPKAKKVN
jgi:hypothetical protein